MTNRISEQPNPPENKAVLYARTASGAVIGGGNDLAFLAELLKWAYDPNEDGQLVIWDNREIKALLIPFGDRVVVYTRTPQGFMRDDGYTKLFDTSSN